MNDQQIPESTIGDSSLRNGVAGASPAARRPSCAEGAPLVSRFATYQDLKRFLWEEYVPLPEEVTDPSLGFVAGASWAKRDAPRFYRVLRAVEGSVRPGGLLLDIGTYPGTFPRLARAAFGPSLRLSACGMTSSREFLNRLAEEGITFRTCNLDPMVCSPDSMVHSPVELPPGNVRESMPTGLPFEDDVVDIITCTEVVEHLFSLKTLLTEAARVLKPGGLLYITTNNIQHRAGLLRIFREGDTNLDDDVDQTTIWADATTPRRGHVRFYSIPLLARAADRAGLTLERAGYFQFFEDPDTIPWPDGGPLGPLRRRLRGHSDRPPIYLRLLARSLIHLGPRSLARRFDSYLEVTFRKVDPC
jgi:SAM-dependent methyltransferase